MWLRPASGAAVGDGDNATTPNCKRDSQTKAATANFNSVIDARAAVTFLRRCCHVFPYSSPVWFLVDACVRRPAWDPLRLPDPPCPYIPWGQTRRTINAATKITAARASSLRPQWFTRTCSHVARPLPASWTPD